MTTVGYLGHSVFAFEHEGKTALVDPWLTGNPWAAITADEVGADVIFLTRDQIDHIGDTVALAKRTGAPAVAIVEIAAELDKEGVQTMGPDMGGSVDLGWVFVKLTPAWHTSTTPTGTVNTPAGLLIEIGGKRIYNQRAGLAGRGSRRARPPGSMISSLAGVGDTSGVFIGIAFCRDHCSRRGAIG